MRPDGLAVYSLAVVQYSNPSAIAVMAIALEDGIRSMHLNPAPPQFLAQGAFKKYLEEQYIAAGDPITDNGGAHSGKIREGWMAIKPELGLALLCAAEAETNSEKQRSLIHLPRIKEMFTRAAQGQAMDSLQDPLLGSRDSYERLEKIKCILGYNNGARAQGFVVCYSKPTCKTHLNINPRYFYARMCTNPAMRIKITA
jgi:hypothetical protein